MMEGRSTRLKERVARLFRASSLLRSTCTHSATATARSLAADIADEPVFVPATSLRFHLDRSLSLPFSEEAPAHAPRRSVDCGGCRPSRSAEQKARKKKKERRVRENGGFYETGEAEGRICPPATPSSPSKSLYYHYCFNGDEGTKKKKKKRSTKKLLSNGYGFSSSSSVESGDDELGLFSSDEKEEAETETLFSSKSFSSDSSEFYQRPASKKKKKSNKSSSFRRPPQRRNGFQPLLSLSERKKDAAAAEEEEGERGVAVVKRSRDPYGDFRSSMVEMIVERQTFGSAELERLLQSYLALNSRHHHPAILRAFSDIWEALFTN